ncbi:hypothetical protein L218DRAFT_1035842, partial [Marasmius fiardii PR-910]
MPSAVDNTPHPQAQQSVLSGASGVYFGGTTTWINILGDQINDVTRSHQRVVEPKTIKEALTGIDYSYRHDSQARFPPPKCSEGTREEILRQVLDKWACTRSWKNIPPVCWLRGSAGVGKSAIAQTVAERCQGRELIASFFFSRSDANRNNIHYFALAIADSITKEIPSLRKRIIQTVQDRPEILRASLNVQFRVLVIESLQNALSTPFFILRPCKLIVIDGLVECVAVDEQQQVLSLVSAAVKEKLPLHFLICSRPEPPIYDRFNQDDLNPYTRSISLN